MLQVAMIADTRSRSYTCFGVPRNHREGGDEIRKRRWVRLLCILVLLGGRAGADFADEEVDRLIKLEPGA